MQVFKKTFVFFLPSGLTFILHRMKTALILKSRPSSCQFAHWNDRRSLTIYLHLCTRRAALNSSRKPALRKNSRLPMKYPCSAKLQCMA